MPAAITTNVLTIAGNDVRARQRLRTFTKAPSQNWFGKFLSHCREVWNHLSKGGIVDLEWQRSYVVIWLREAGSGLGERL